MSQYEQENDLGGGGGEVDDDTSARAWETAAERRDPRAGEDDADREEDAEA